MKQEKIEIFPGMFSTGYKCQKCGEVEFNEEQMRKALEIKEKAIKIMVKRKLGKVGGSLVLRIPKEVEESLNLKSGKNVRIIVEKKKMIVEADNYLIPIPSSVSTTRVRSFFSKTNIVSV